MKTRTLFLTLLASISILLITSGLAFADSITGCVKKSRGVIYNVQTGDTPVHPCHFLDKQITWSEEGPQGEQGSPGENGQDGEQGPPGPAGGAPQFILKDGKGLQMGTVVTVNDDFVLFDESGGFVGQNRSVLVALDIQRADTTTATVGISVDRFNIHFQNRVVFESTDCTGPARIRDHFIMEHIPNPNEDFLNLDFPPAFTLSVVGGDPTNPDTGVRKLYVRANEAEPQIIPIQSVLAGDNCFGPISPPLNVTSVSVELILIEGELLHLAHPAQYTLEKF